MTYKTFSKLTLLEYQELYRINTSDSDEIDKAISSVSVLTGLPRWEVEEMKMTDFNRVSAELATIFSNEYEYGKPSNIITLAGKRYLIQLNPRKLTAGQYIDIQNFIKGNMIENMHKVIASMIVPLNWLGRAGKYDAAGHETIAEEVRKMLFVDINSICVFFSNLWRVSTPVMENYLLQELKKKMSPENYQSLKEMDLRTIMDGFITLPKFQTMKK